VVNTGLYNISIRALAVNASGTIFAGTDGAAFRSTDNGAHWTAANTALTTTYAFAINVSGKVFAGGIGGVCGSTDNGANWTQVNTGLTNIYISSLAVNADGDIYAGSFGDGVFRSTDNGSNWTTNNTGLANLFVRSLVINANGVMFAGAFGEGGVFRSANNGAGWVSTGLGYAYTYALAIGDGGQIFAGTDGAVSRSTDNGANWTQVNLSPYADVTALAINAGGNIFAGLGFFPFGGGGVLRSSDHGSHWAQVNTGLTDTNIVSLAINGTGTIFAGTWGNPGVGHLFRSTDNGANWARTGLVNPPSTVVSSLAINASGYIFAGTDVGVFRSTDNGANWTNTGLANTPVAALCIDAGGYIYAGTIGGGVYRSVQSTSSIPTAGLQLWLKADAGVDTLNGTVSRWHDQSGNGNDAIQASASRQPLLVAGQLNGMPVVSFDGVNDKLGFTGTTHMTQFSLFLVINNHPGTPGNEGHIIIFGANGDYDHQWFMGPTPSDSIGMATGWTNYINAISPGLGAYNQWRNLSVVTTGSVWNTTVQWDGNNAHMSPGGFDQAISVPMGDATGSGGGIGGADGVPVGTLLAKCDVAEVIVYNVALSDSMRRTVEQYLATKYGLPWPSAGVVEHQNGNLPERFVLEQNYPNPFNPSTTISYRLPSRSNVILTVFNTLGQRVAVLEDGEREAGYHEVRFEASNLASGVYFYRLQAGEFVQSRKFVLQK
jgi:hypothetical protein